MNNFISQTKTISKSHENFQNLKQTWMDGLSSGLFASINDVFHNQISFRWKSSCVLLFYIIIIFITIICVWSIFDFRFLCLFDLFVFCFFTWQMNSLVCFLDVWSTLVNSWVNSNGFNSYFLLFLLFKDSIFILFYFLID